MLFTWAIESVLIGLAGQSVLQRHWMVTAQLWLALGSLGCHLVVAALDWRGAAHSCALGYLAVVTGFLLVSALEPLTSLPPIINLCFFLVVELAGMGMAFSTRRGQTALFLHPRCLFALEAVLLLNDCGGWSVWVAVALSAGQLAPWDTAALAFTAAAAGYKTVGGALGKDWWQVGTHGGVALVAVLWLVTEWLGGGEGGEGVAGGEEGEEDGSTAPSAPPKPSPPSLDPILPTQITPARRLPPPFAWPRLLPEAGARIKIS
jgi:hypothetical protein